MFNFGRNTERFLAYCFVSVLFLFANHCFLEEACASLGKVDLGAHPISDSSSSENDPCHEHSSDSEKESASCPIMGISLNKLVTNYDYDYLTSLSLSFSWVLSLSFSPASLIIRSKHSNSDPQYPRTGEDLLTSLHSAPQAPPLS
ncbi:MAG: hypothetical protein WD512_08320 [Candidatus Paceibacterota bacterium]